MAFITALMSGAMGNQHPVMNPSSRCTSLSDTALCRIWLCVGCRSPSVDTEKPCSPPESSKVDIACAAFKPSVCEIQWGHGALCRYATPSVEIVGSILRKRFSETVERVAYRSSSASFPGFPSQSVASAGASFFSVMFGQISESSALSSRKFS